VAALAAEDSALLIDCRSLEAQTIPLVLGDACILICDTRVKHELASSAYNERRAQCAEGVALLSRALPGIRALRDVTSAELDAHGGALPELARRRCRHVITEDVRTRSAVVALRAGRLQDFGALMLASHGSLRSDYEVSSPELDAAVETACAERGVYGARMTGGGFGGSAIALVARERVDAVTDAVERRFAELFRVKPRFFASRGCAGVREDCPAANADQS
jgi:galactokinase